MTSTRPQSCPQHYDTLITRAQIIDGTGNAGYVADLAIKDGLIAAVGNCLNTPATETINAQGLVLSPGFIDTHTHDDWAVLETPQMPCKITQGVTTVVTGNCGISAAPFQPNPLLPDPFQLIPGMAKYRFNSVQDYQHAIIKCAPAVNVRMLIGHSSLRACVMGEDMQRPASSAELEQMATQLDLALQQGAAGLSSGLDYAAALAAEESELVALAKVVARYPNKVYSTHVRDEGDEVIAAVEEALSTAKAAQAPLILSHHKCAGKANFGKSQSTLSMIDNACKHQQVGLDAYPYTASSTCLSRRFLDSADDIMVTWSDSLPQYNGMMLDDIAADLDTSREQACDQLQPAGAIYFDMHEDDLQRILQHPNTMIGSDGLPGTPNPHPRLWGTFSRVLGHYVRDRKLFSLAMAIHKMTGLSARQFGLLKRGIIRTGYAADLVLFDADKITDIADFSNPEVASIGIHHVWVNGQSALRYGQPCESHAGHFLTD